MQLLAAVGLGDGEMANVVVDVEVGIFEPPRPIEVQRHPMEPTAEPREQVQPVTDQGAQRIERDLVGALQAIEHHEHRVVPEIVPGLGRDQFGLARGELLHQSSLERKGPAGTSPSAGPVRSFSIVG